MIEYWAIIGSFSGFSLVKWYSPNLGLQFGGMKEVGFAFLPLLTALELTAEDINFKLKQALGMLYDKPSL